MTTFHVSYYKVLQNCEGRTFKCLQRTVDVDAASPVAALKSIDDRGQSLPDCDCLEVTKLINADVARAAWSLRSP
jgi:hypothetical protein